MILPHISVPQETNISQRLFNKFQSQKLKNLGATRSQWSGWLTHKQFYSFSISESWYFVTEILGPDHQNCIPTELHIALNPLIGGILLPTWGLNYFISLFEHPTPLSHFHLGGKILLMKSPGILLLFVKSESLMSHLYLQGSAENPRKLLVQIHGSEVHLQWASHKHRSISKDFQFSM